MTATAPLPAERWATALRQHLWWVLAAVPFAAFVIRGWAVIAPGGNLGWDTNWYAEIATQGYHFDGDYSVQQNVAFFPLMPLLVALVQAVFHTSIGHTQVAVAATLTLVACWYFYRTLRHLHGEAVATMAVGLLASHPFALYLYNGYSEPAALAPLAAMFYYLYAQPNLTAATLCVVLASVARPWGVFVAGFFALHVLAKWRFGKDPQWTRAVLLNVPASLLGFLSLAAYFQFRFDDPLLSSHAAAAWAGPFKIYDLMSVLALEAPIRAFQAGLAEQTLLDPVMVGVTLFLTGCAAQLACVRRFPLAINLYGLLLPLILYVTTLGQRTGVNNAGRYSAVLFVHAAAVALVLQAVGRALRDPGQPANNGEIPPVFFVAYAMGLAGLLRYTNYFFSAIWVS